MSKVPVLSVPPTDEEMDALFDACALANGWAYASGEPWYWRVWAIDNMDRLVSLRRAVKAGYYTDAIGPKGSWDNPVDFP